MDHSRVNGPLAFQLSLKVTWSFGSIRYLVDPFQCVPFLFTVTTFSRWFVVGSPSNSRNIFPSAFPLPRKSKNFGAHSVHFQTFSCIDCQSISSLKWACYFTCPSMTFPCHRLTNVFLCSLSDGIYSTMTPEEVRLFHFLREISLLLLCSQYRDSRSHRLEPWITIGVIYHYIMTDDLEKCWMCIRCNFPSFLWFVHHC